MDRPSSLRLEQLQHELIQPFSFTLQAAEVCCIQGASGSGKSRLLRALAWPLQALLLDEPTANLDPATTLQVEAWLLDQIRQHGWPVFWIAHDPAQVARVADRRLVLQQGRMQELRHERD